MTKYIAYVRVSTKKQGRTGLGLTAQREIIKHNVGEPNIVKWYKDVHSGKNIEVLPNLQKAKEHAKKSGHVLVIAKTDRLRNTQQALDLVDEMTPEGVFFCNVGRNADKFTLTLFFAFAEKERLEISIRTKAALAVLKAKGVKLGPPVGWNIKKQIRKDRSIKAGRTRVCRTVMENKKSSDLALILKKDGKTYRYIADVLNRCGYRTRTGGKWHQSAVYNMLQRLEKFEKIMLEEKQLKNIL